MYERPFQDAENCQACSDDIRRLLSLFRVGAFQRCEVRWRWSVSHHTVTVEGLEERLPFREDILDMRNDSFFPVHISQKMKMVKTLSCNVWNFGV